MAGKKSGKSAESEQLIAAAEELRKAAELLMGRAADADSSAPKKSSTKKSSTTKKSTPKSTTSKPKSTTSKPKTTKPKAKPEEQPAEEAEEKPKTQSAAKPKSSGKKTAKKPAAASDEPKEEPVNDEPKEEEVAAVEEPKVEPEPIEEPKEEPKAEEVAVEEPKPVEQPKEEPKEEPKTEPERDAVNVYCPKCGAQNTSGYKFCMQCGAPLEGSTTVEPKTEKPQADRREKKLNVGAVADRTEDFIKNKGKLPIFIIVNALFLVCSILLMTVSFHINSWGADGDLVGHGYTTFSYFRNYSEVIGLFGSTASNWNTAAFLIIGTLMIAAMLMPLALIVKNVIILIVKKDRSVYKIDAVIAFSFLLFYMTMINFFGANVPVGPTISFIIAAINLAFTIFADLLINRKNGQKFPLFSIAVIALATLAIFLFTSFRIYYQARQGVRDNEYYGASAASVAGGFMFVTYLIAVLALIALIVVQLWKLPSVIDIILPSLAAVCSVLTLIVARAGMPDGYSFGSGFTVGTIVTLIIAVAYLLFTVIPPLRKKYKIQLNTLKPDFATVDTEEQAAVTQETIELLLNEDVAEEPKEEHVEEEVKEGYCYECDTQNVPGSKFCNNCGAKLKK